MKRLFFLSITLIICQIGFCQDSDIIGVWQLENEAKEQTILKFNTDQTASFGIKGKELLFSSYSIKPNTNPMQITLFSKIHNKEITLYLLAELLTPTSMKIETSPMGSDTHKTEFSQDPGNQIVLMKQE